MKSLYATAFFLCLSVFPYSLFAQNNVGVGTATPASKLAVKGNLSIGNNYSGTAAPADGLLIEGKVGIGTITPTGVLHVLSIVGDTCMVLENNSVGGYAAKLKGALDVQHEIKNTGNSFAGSVAVNDGLTVGDITTGTTCTPNISTTCSLYWYDGVNLSSPNPTYNIEPEGLFPATNHIQDFTSTCNLGDCRVVTKVIMTTRFKEQSAFAIKVGITIRNGWTYTVFTNKAGGNTNPAPFDTIRTFIDSTTAGNQLLNTDPAGSWNVKMEGIDPTGDSDWIIEYEAIIKYKYGINTTLGAFAGYGEVRASSSLYANSIHEYGDVAEFMKVAANNQVEPEPGDLVSIDPKNPQSFVLSTKANDPLLVGAISKNPSVFINSPESGKPIALTGRVEVKVNTEGGVIKPGDPITSSSTPGIGMKMNQTGTVLGYALEAFDGSRTENGKVWILLARGHYEGLDKSIKIVEDNDVKLGGVEFQGAKRITNEKEVFVAWNKSLLGNIPADMDFDDLVIDINPFGGNGQFVVKEVNSEGFTVAISKKSSSLQGFYYTVNFVSPLLYQEGDNSTAVASAEHSTVAAEAKSLYQSWVNKTNKLIEKSGRSTAGLVAKGMSGDEIMKEKAAVDESWKKADRKTYEERDAIGFKLEELLNNNPGVRFTDLE